jgi:hypothetical protein
MFLCLLVGCTDTNDFWSESTQRLGHLLDALGPAPEPQTGIPRVVPDQLPSGLNLHLL